MRGGKRTRHASDEVILVEMTVPAAVAAAAAAAVAAASVAAADQACASPRSQYSARGPACLGGPVSLE